MKSQYRNSLYLCCKNFRAQKMHENYFHEYNYTMYIHVYTIMHTTCKNFLFNSICTKIILTENFLDENLLDEKKVNYGTFTKMKHIPFRFCWCCWEIAPCFTTMVIPVLFVLWMTKAKRLSTLPVVSEKNLHFFSIQGSVVQVGLCMLVRHAIEMAWRKGCIMLAGTLKYNEMHNFHTLPHSMHKLLM